MEHHFGVTIGNLSLLGQLVRAGDHWQTAEHRLAGETGKEPVWVVASAT